ncbi:hypothetical protein [Mycolicibacterium sp. J2]|uniref:hypothetical protein n=1 Tax=Mycolicibacterium sp. J2 TaxID=2993511 RepID=UPI00224B16EE|nr:hypothetical protein [Mycolicibacterium sp. J2]MCX2716097.1 hypothetical protein [Mycolicibacterium sp. J2]
MIDMDTENNDADHVAVLIAQLRRNRNTITRRRTSLQQALDHQKHFIREAVEHLPPKKVARLTGLTEGRISQIRNELGSPISMFDLM